MVLTRRAAKTSKSIIRCLPNEILATAMRYASISDLVTLCRTSRLMSNLATPLLYRSITLSTVPQLKAFLHNMDQAQPLSHHVREFEVASEDDFELSLHLQQSMSAVVAGLCHLETLGLIPVAPHSTELLQDAYFPNLSKFSSAVEFQTSALLPSFLTRHPTITHLTFTRDGISALHPILLPNLEDYDGPSSYVSALRADSAPINSVCLVWYSEDLDIELPLRRIAEMAIASPTKFAGICVTNNIRPSTIIAGVAAHLPYIHDLMLYTWPLTAHDILDMTTHLNDLTALSGLKVLEPMASDRNFTDDPESIKSWCEACKTLSSITLHGRD
ncbi:hypothetical protein B0H14DRAFT_3179273 [Mycena olivaceomarginata]|nr:hypothetical protein B0H14DRAFT_3179273 [Mycena olivaceomarginata]